jgi:hypothetical protein
MVDIFGILCILLEGVGMFHQHTRGIHDTKRLGAP